MRDLKLANNKLTHLDESIGTLTNLELLDIHNNAITALPESLIEMVKLRTINISENKLVSIPFKSLSKLPLVELLAAKNCLSGVLVDEEVQELSNLQMLDITGNSITKLSESTTLALPLLQTLECSANRIEGLPNMSSWTQVVTLIADDNKISSIPEGFTSLSKVRNVDLTGNDIRNLDNRIGEM